MRKLGYLAEVTERWIPGALKRKDLWGWCDVLCVHEETGEIVAVQTTSYGNMPARVKKIADADTTPAIRKAGVRIIVHGWRKKGRFWEVKCLDIS